MVVEVSMQGKCVARGALAGAKYPRGTASVQQDPKEVLTTGRVRTIEHGSMEWHETGVHCSKGTLRRKGLHWDYGECRYCTESNLRRTRDQRSGVVRAVSTGILKRVSVELIGPVQRSVGGNMTVLHIVDI